MDTACLERLEAFVQTISNFDSLEKELQVAFVAYALMENCQKTPCTALDVHEVFNSLRLSLAPLSLSVASHIFKRKKGTFLLKPPGYVLTRQGEKSIREALATIIKTQSAGNDDATRPADSYEIVPLSVTQGTRTYIENIVHQINGSYERGWYDACAVMMRRLVETLLIEAVNSKGDETAIKTPDGDYVPLERLIGVATSGLLDLTRDTKRELRNIKNLGDKSAHSRRFCARRGDIDHVRLHFRAAVEELAAILQEED